MNKYIKMFMDDNNLKVGEKFKQKDGNKIYHFDENGFLMDEEGYMLDANDIASFLYGYYEVVKLKNEPWKPKLDEKYWFVSQYGDVNYNYNDDDEYDKYILTHRPIFQTRYEADDYKWFLDKIDEYKKPLKPKECNYYLFYDHDDKKVYRTCDTSCQGQGNVYFGDKENIEKFLEEVGEERIKKYMFDIWQG